VERLFRGDGHLQQQTNLLYLWDQLIYNLLYLSFYPFIYIF
jgi:hypothetical protein